MVVVVPVEIMICRMVKFPVSATYRFPVLSTVMPDGLSKEALLPIPSLLPGVWAMPAMVVTTPVGDITRIRRHDT